MEISDFPWFRIAVFSILALHIVSRMRSHVFFVADLIDPYPSPRCITQNMALARATHTLMTMGGIVSIVSAVCAQQYAPCRRHAHHAFLQYAVLSAPSGAGCVATHK
jgi:hypothetical protein